jgi:hypothetical protein
MERARENKALTAAAPQCSASTSREWGDAYRLAADRWSVSFDENALLL